MDLCRKRRIVTTIMRSSRTTTQQLKICWLWYVRLVCIYAVCPSLLTARGHPTARGMGKICALPNIELLPEMTSFPMLVLWILISVLPTRSDKNTTAGNAPSSGHIVHFGIGQQG